LGGSDYFLNRIFECKAKESAIPCILQKEGLRFWVLGKWVSLLKVFVSREKFLDCLIVIDVFQIMLEQVVVVLIRNIVEQEKFAEYDSVYKV